MSDRDHLVNLQGSEHRLQFILLLLRGIGVLLFLVRSSPTEKVEGDDLATLQGWNEAIVDVQIVGKAVHQDECRTRSRVMANVDVEPLMRDQVFPIGLRYIHDRTPLNFAQAISSHCISIQRDAPESALMNAMRPILPRK